MRRRWLLVALGVGGLMGAVGVGLLVGIGIGGRPPVNERGVSAEVVVQGLATGLGAGLGAGLCIGLPVLLVRRWSWFWNWLQAPAVEATRLRQQAVNADIEPKDRLGLRKDLLQVENATRGMMLQSAGTLVQSLGLLGLVVTLFGTCLNLQVAQENLRATQTKLDIDREGLVTDRFNKATEHLGAVAGNHPSVHTRIGGIYALERIAKNAPNPDGDYRSAMAVLTAYVRERSPVGEWRPCLSRADAQQIRLSTKRPPEDVQAALTVLGRRNWSFGGGETTVLLLDHTNLRGVLLTSARLHTVSLIGTHLEAAFLNGADLERASLNGSRLEAAFMARTNLKEASLDHSCLTEANLEGADLEGINLEEADLTGANLRGANLRGANLRGARGLSREQLNQAVTDQRTVLPDGLR